MSEKIQRGMAHFLATNRSIFLCNCTSVKNLCDSCINCKFDSSVMWHVPAKCAEQTFCTLHTLSHSACVHQPASSHYIWSQSWSTSSSQDLNNRHEHLHFVHHGISVCIGEALCCWQRRSFWMMNLFENLHLDEQTPILRYDQIFHEQHQPWEEQGLWEALTNQ